MKVRCEWAGDHPLMVEYHDREWGAVVHDDQELFEFLILEGAQAGLSWMTILNKRENYRAAFEGFDPQTVARFDDAKKQQLMGDAGIVRNRLKIASAIANAQAFLRVQEEFGSFDRYVWGFVDGAPIQNKWKSMAEIPAQTETSQRMSKELKKRGFKFVGPTICYAYMQSVGMVNDHKVDCFRYDELSTK